jgi:DNA-directed RNA polymerase subunit H (RpoH/RPB5)
LNKEEAEAYKEKYQSNATTTQIYRLDDPIVRYYYGQPGDIFHIQRFKGGENYRLVGKRLIYASEKK